MKLIQLCKKIAQTSGLLSLARQTVPGNCTPVAEFGLVMNRFSSESCRLYLYMESNSILEPFGYILRQLFVHCFEQKSFNLFGTSVSETRPV